MGNPGAILPLHGNFSKALKAQGKTVVWGRWGDPEDVPHPWKTQVSPAAGWETTKQSTELHVLSVRVCTGLGWGGGGWWGGGITVTGIAVRGVSRRKPFSHFSLLSLEQSFSTAALLTFGTGSFFAGAADLYCRRLSSILGP